MKKKNFTNVPNRDKNRINKIGKKTFHKTLKKWKAKSERGGRMFVKFAIIMDLDSLLESQTGNVRHKSPHATSAKGYQDGVEKSYN